MQHNTTVHHLLALLSSTF